MKKLCVALTLIFSFLGLSAAEFKTVTDMSGGEIKIPEKVEKIAALWHANNQIILMLGGADKIIATTDKIKQNKWFAHIYPRILSVPASLNGDDIQIEELVKLNPDVVIVSNKNYRDELMKNGFNVLHAIFRNHEDMKKSVLMTAKAIGADAVDRANEFNAYFAENIKKITDVTNNIANLKRPKVLHIVSGANLLKIDGTKTIIDEWIKIAGGENAIKKEGNMIEITMEEIINANPEVIIVGGAKSGEAVEKIYQNAAYSGIKAVQDKRVYANPSGVFSWDRYGAEGALQILWAAKTLHPEPFKDLDVKEHAKRFYKKFMNYELSDTEFEYISQGLSPKGE